LGRGGPAGRANADLAEAKGTPYLDGKLQPARRPDRTAEWTRNRPGELEDDIHEGGVRPHGLRVEQGAAVRRGLASLDTELPGDALARVPAIGDEERHGHKPPGARQRE